MLNAGMGQSWSFAITIRVPPHLSVAEGWEYHAYLAQTMVLSAT
jgi:hypothetical protein